MGMDWKDCMSLTYYERSMYIFIFSYVALIIGHIFRYNRYKDEKSDYYRTKMAYTDNINVQIDALIATLDVG